MMRKKIFFSLLVLLAAISLAGTALADSITPVSYSGTLGAGESVTINKTVTVTTAPTGLVDVFFLTDSTGSMGGAIGSVQSSASSILSTVSGMGADVAFGVGEYKDVGDTFVYQLNTDITTSTAAAQTGINAWSAYGGGDGPEAQLYALDQVATTSSWRTGSTRIVVWFGDYPGHDPSGPTGVTEAQATASLVANNITVDPIDLLTLDAYGQATRIATATGGTYYTGIDTSSIVTAITDAIETSITTYSTVSLDLSGVPAGLTASVIPGSYTGAYDRTIERTFDFAVTLTCDTPGTYGFTINALVDGGVVASESDRINAVPVPATLLLFGSGLLGLAGFRKKIRK